MHIMIKYSTQLYVYQKQSVQAGQNVRGESVCSYELFRRPYLDTPILVSKIHSDRFLPASNGLNPMR